MLRPTQISKILNLNKCTLEKAHRTFSNATTLVEVDMNDKTGVAVVTMNRPPNNALNLDLFTALNNTLDGLASNKTRGMILTSSSPKIFSAGLDLTEAIKPNLDRATAFWVAFQDCWEKLYGSFFPTAAAINGHSPAGGCLLAMCCEYRVMVNGKFGIGLNETSLGMIAPPFFQTTMRVTISPRDAEMALTQGTLFSPEEAMKIRLIDEMAKNKEDAVKKCEAWLEKFSKFDATARNMTKFSYRQKTLMDVKKGREEDLKNFLNLIQMPRFQEAMEKNMQVLRK